MMFCINPGSIVSRLGAPLQGRVTFYRHDTDELATIYTLEGQEFVQAANPQLLDVNGRLDDSVFFDCGIVDVRIEQYTGPDGFLSVDAPDEYFAAFDIFEYGIKMDDGGAIGHVETIADLRGVSPDAKFVWVNGYYAVGDAPSRLYYWDEASEDIEDGGYVVGSDVEGATGKWILLWGDEVLPCTVYGVMPGQEANLAALLDYPAFVGSMSIKTAPCVRFLAGTYTSASNYTSARTLCFDTGAKFTGAKFIVPEVRTFGPVTDYIANFELEENATAHSSWFRTAKAFFLCGAKNLVLDHDNFFDSAVIDDTVLVSNACITGIGRLPLTYSNGGYLYFGDCDIRGQKILDPAIDYVRFSSSRWQDEIWIAGTKDFGTISNGNKLQFLSADSNTINCFDFANVGEYIACVTANGNTTLDLCGRSTSGGIASNTQFTTIKNGTFGGVVYMGAATATVENVNATIARQNGGAFYADGGKIALSGACSDIILTDVDFTADATIDPKTTNVKVTGGVWRGQLAMADADIDTGAKCVYMPTFDGVEILSGNAEWKVNCINMRDCTANVRVNVYPFLDNNAWFVDLTFDSNKFSGNGGITIANPPTSDAENTDFGWLFVVNNVFDINDTVKAFKAPFYTNEANLFWKNLPSVSKCTYKNNSGVNVPAEKPKREDSDLMDDTYSSHNVARYSQLLFNVGYGTLFTSEHCGYYMPMSGGTFDGQTVKGYGPGKFKHVAVEDPTENDVFEVKAAWDSGNYVAGVDIFFVN